MNTDNSSIINETDKSNNTYETFASDNKTNLSDSEIVKSEEKLIKLNQEANQELEQISKPFYKLNLLETAIELKNTWFDIMDELLAGNFSMDILIKNNRMFYVGLTILIIAIILYIYDYAFDNNDPLKNLLLNGGNGVVEIRHIYEQK